MYSATTRDIRVTVKPVYLEEQSNPEEHQFVWAYHVMVENLGEGTVQLVNRYWHITDARGRVQEVRGQGVVGEQPTLRPRQYFEYSSGTPLPTPSGIMQGHYEMVSERGEVFPITIPAFSLDIPDEKGKLN